MLMGEDQNWMSGFVCALLFAHMLIDGRHSMVRALVWALAWAPTRALHRSTGTRLGQTMLDNFLPSWVSTCY